MSAASLQHAWVMGLRCQRCGLVSEQVEHFPCCDCAAELRREVELLRAAVARITGERDHFRRQLDTRALEVGT